MGAALRPGGVLAVLGPDGGKQFKAFARVGALGIELALSTVVGLLGGRWLDAKFHTAPWLTLAGLLLGLIAGFRSFYLAARKQTQAPPHHDE